MAIVAAINGTGGYNTTLGSTLTDAGASTQSIGDSRIHWDQAELPALSIFQGTVSPADMDNEAQRVLRQLPLVFRGSLEKETTAAKARQFIADIYRAIRSAGDKWPVSGTDLAHHTVEGDHRIIYTEEYELVGVEVEINIFYIGNHLDMEA